MCTATPECIYDPTTGTFLSPDPLAAEPYGSEEATTTVANAYHYVSNDPLNFTDPLGLCRTTDVEFQIPGDSGADVEVLTGPDGGYTYDQCKNSAAVDCTSPTPIVEGDAYIPTGNTSRVVPTSCVRQWREVELDSPRLWPGVPAVGLLEL